MTDAEQEIARRELMRGLSLPQIIDDLDGRLYRDLVDAHANVDVQDLGPVLEVHRQLIKDREREAAAEIVDASVKAAQEAGFWPGDAGDFLNSISCDLNDGMFPERADEAGIFNLFQLLTITFANRVRSDPEFSRLVHSAPAEPPAAPGASGAITRMLGIAISDFEAGRLSRRNLLRIFQDALDNGDILGDENEVYVVSHVAPLIDAGELRSSVHFEEFERKMSREIMEHLRQTKRAKPAAAAKPQWWKFWK